MNHKINKYLFSLLICFLFYLPIYGNDEKNIDSIKCRILYHPYTYEMYTIHDRVDLVLLREVFFKTRKNKIVYPGLTVESFYFSDSIFDQFDSMKCSETNRVIAFSEELKKLIIKINLIDQKKLNNINQDSSYYQGLHFYVFDVIMIVDPSKRKYTDSVLDLKYKYQTRPLKKQIELYTIIKFIEIKPLPLRKHKLKKNGKIYPIK